MGNRASSLSSAIREQAATLEKTEFKLNEIKEKLSLATSADDSKDIKNMRAGITRIIQEIKEMEQKKEIISWELRNHLLRQKNKGKDDYLEINYLGEG